MSSGFITRVGEGQYRIEFETDDQEKYEAVQLACRRTIDHTKPLEKMTAFDVLDEISSAYAGKQIYFMEPNGIIYGREECAHMTLEEAVANMARRVGDDGID